MRAVTVLPGIGNSVRLEEVGEPRLEDGSVAVRTLALGICGTDRDIVSGAYGSAPPGETRLVLGHESLGCVEIAPPDSGLVPGDLIVGIVRRPDPLPCPACAIGEWDMCRNGRYTERGIKQRHGYAAERFRIEPEFAVKIDRGLGLLGVLVEPTSIVVKAWDQVDYIGRRSRAFAPQRLLVTGAGSIGLLAALIGAQRGLEVHVFNRSASGLKTELVRELGAIYHSGDLSLIDHLDADIVMECSGAPSVILALCGRSAPSGVICLAGIANDSTTRPVEPNQLTDMVLQNQVMFGTVNANRNHYREAVAVLERADPAWLTRLITRRVPIDRWLEALEPRPGDIKTVLDFSL